VRLRNGLKQVRPGCVVQARARADREGPARAGFTATRKIGGAVVRNRAKRRLREAARLLLPLHGCDGVDYVFIARAATPERAWPALLDDVKTALVSLQRALGAEGGAPADAADPDART